MFGLNFLSKAIAALTASLTTLASTVAEINSGLRGRFQLDDHTEPDLLPNHVDDEVPTVRKGRTKAATTTE
jgi:hypothetical protein